MTAVRQLTPWATSAPLAEPPPGHSALPAVGDRCPECGAAFTLGEAIHKVTERADGVYVCHRHDGRTPPREADER